jgi:hypothetical protein
VVKPINTRISRSGTHGEDYYVHEYPLGFLILYSSNGGNKPITVPDILKPIQKQFEIM